MLGDKGVYCIDPGQSAQSALADQVRNLLFMVIFSACKKAILRHVLLAVTQNYCLCIHNALLSITVVHLTPFC